ncbi:hypothetical protein F383_15932 [Gossypium arboreum]|uniref:Uncharacterized protein n=1 Tax=Gossypium arboreum TaxID=29729 RepID=A0A0B0PTF0_GOSAR|nr:hypothetical protein F383_15932 [Gossypium arboreum]
MISYQSIYSNISYGIHRSYTCFDIQTNHLY